MKVNQQLNIGVQAWLNYHYELSPWLPHKLFNYSVLGSVYIEL